jgi:hypothetical protein
VAKELQELLLAREEALVAWEEKMRFSERALTKVSADLDVEWVKAEVTRKEYLDKMPAHTIYVKHSLGLDKMLGEKKIELDEQQTHVVEVVDDELKVLEVDGLVSGELDAKQGDATGGGSRFT